jgi:hypothetical protein
MFLSGFILHEEPCTDPYARFCGQTEASASSDPMVRPLQPRGHKKQCPPYAFAGMVVSKLVKVQSLPSEKGKCR